MVFVCACARVLSPMCTQCGHSQNISEVGCALVYFKDHFEGRSLYATHTCLRKEKLIKDVNSGVHKLKMPIIDGDGCARAVWFLSVFASSCRFSPGFSQSHPML